MSKPIIDLLSLALAKKAEESPSGEIKLQDKDIVPSKEEQTVKADFGYQGLNTVTVDKIPDEYIVPEGNLDITSDGKFNVKNKETVTVTLNSYDSNYEVTPNISGQSLETKNKFLSKDIVIKPIPFYETDNSSEGTTVYIGKEVE